MIGEGGAAGNDYECPGGTARDNVVRDVTRTGSLTVLANIFMSRQVSALLTG